MGCSCRGLVSWTRRLRRREHNAMTTLICCRCNLPSTPPFTGVVPKGEAVSCIPCLTTLSGYDSTKPDPAAGGAEEAIAVLASLMCGGCYDPLLEIGRDFTGSGMVRLCGDCARNMAGEKAFEGQPA